jgi:carboxynorspermidine decarboxylase
MNNEYKINQHDMTTLKTVKTPSYVIDKKLLIQNLERLQYVQDQTGCKILLALKGFSMHSTFSLVGEYLAGITASSLFEAKLGREFMNKEVHVYAPAYRDDEFDEIMDTCDHIVFNSVDQYKHFKDKVSKSKTIECGLRVNPQYSEVETALYDPCAPNSRLGTIESKIKAGDLEGLSGLHFHTMCEQQVDTLVRTIEVVETKFG